MTGWEIVLDVITMISGVAICIMIVNQFIILPTAKAMRMRKRMKKVKCNWEMFYRTLTRRSRYGQYSVRTRIRYKRNRSKSNYSRASYSNGKQGRIIRKRCVLIPLTMALLLVRRTPMYDPNNEINLQFELKIKEPAYVDLTGMFDNTDKNTTDTITDNDIYISHPAINIESFESEYILATRTAQHNGKGTNIMKFDHDSYRIGIDSLASACMSPYKEDFIPDTLKQLPRQQQVKPYGKGTAIPIVSTGTISWKIEDDKGKRHTFLIPNSIYIPEGSMRLLSPQHWAKEATSTWHRQARDHYNSTQYWDRNILSWGKTEQYRLTVRNDRRSNVPIFFSASSTKKYQAYTAQVNDKIDNKYLTCCPAHYISDVESDDETANTTEAAEIIPIEPQDEVQRINEVNERMTDIMTQLTPRATQVVEEEDEQVVTATSAKAELMRWHYRLGHLSFKKLKVLAECNIIPRKLAEVRCPKCAGCIYGKMHRKPWRSKAQPGRIAITTRAGQCISVDQLESSTVGFIGQLKGKLTTQRYKYATVFVDHFSRYTYVHLQKSLTSEETLEAKRAFEAHCRKYNVNVENYHADNGRFADNLYVNDVRAKGQTITYCGVNAHWQNGIAERMIRTLRETARTQLLHAIERWPSNCSTHLWPFALRYAAQVQNEVPKKDGESPISKFSGVSVQANMNHLHAFGCPVYALNNDLASGKTIGNWNRRARLGIYLGPSPRHARTVSLVMNPSNGLVSPQFHVSHDEFFETVDRSSGEPTAPWKILTGIRGKGAIRTEVSENHRTNQRFRDTTDRVQVTNEDTQSLQDEIEIEGEQESSQQTDLHAEESTRPTTSISRVSGRVRRRTQALQDGIDQGLRITSFKSTVEDVDDYYHALHEDDFELQDKMRDPIAFKANSDPDTMYYHQAIRAPDRKEFLKAIIKEINDHIDGNHWALIPKEEVPEGEKILDSVWAMKRKRDIKTQQVYKHKARLNIHGGQQEYGVHYTDTYSPVVSWFSVRLLLIIAKLNGWHTRQIDFILAYPQADIPYDNYMKLPRGIKTAQGDGDTHVLKLKKNIYGGRNSGRIWNDFLKEGLLNIGFEQSEADECVYYKGDVIFLFYVDDGIFISPTKEKVDKAIADLSNRKLSKNKYDIDDQGDISDYLGINFDLLPDGSLKLWQPHLIDQILDEVGIQPGEKCKPTPAASTRILQRRKEDPPAKFDFNYRKVIGKLNYLEKSSRPDISYAVHQCARFCEDPKEQHIEAVRHLARYLKGTRNEGTIMNPNKEKSFEVWVDADFSGNWCKDTAGVDASTAKSRSGYVLTYGGCPISWTSKLQTQIALSSCESEYIALSQSLRDAIPVMRLLQELKDRNLGGEHAKPIVHCEVFEDNTGALALAMVPRMRPRTKHINLVYHHFREAVRDGTVKVVSVGTKDQIADMFTKPLPQNDFVKFRKRLMGW